MHHSLFFCLTIAELFIKESVFVFKSRPKFLSQNLDLFFLSLDLDLNKYVFPSQALNLDLIFLRLIQITSNSFSKLRSRSIFSESRSGS